MRAETLIRSTVADSPMVRAVPVGAWRSPVSALVWGTRGREFKSRRPDQQNQPVLTIMLPRKHLLGSVWGADRRRLGPFFLGLPKRQAERRRGDGHDKYFKEHNFY
jgi:hypothetical protein